MSSPLYRTSTSTCTQFSFWLARSLIDLENLDERAAAFYRVFDLLVVFYQLHNFSGIVGAVSALESSAVYRLELSYDMAYKARPSKPESICKLPSPSESTSRSVMRYPQESSLCL